MPLACVVLAPLAPLAAFAAPEAHLKFSVGVLGHEVVYHVQGDPFEIFGVAPALSAGPTPLAIIDPSDPRLLDVGTELLSLWDAGVLDGAGEGSLEYGLPRDPALSGIALYAQAVTVPGATTLVDEISNPVKLVLSLEGECHLALGPQAEERRHHTATTLPSGKVLLAGGVDPHPPGLGPPVVLGNAELYNPQTSGFGPPFPLPEPRARHSATLLADGRVLLLGGVGAGGVPLATGTIYDPPAGSFTGCPRC